MARKRKVRKLMVMFEVETNIATANLKKAENWVFENNEMHSYPDLDVFEITNKPKVEVIQVIKDYRPEL